MSYPNFGLLKTITLPVPDDEYTFERYKELYGIDLSDIFYFDVTAIRVKIKNAEFLLSMGYQAEDYYQPPIKPVIISRHSKDGTRYELQLGSIWAVVSDELLPNWGIWVSYDISTKVWSVGSLDI